MKSLAILVVAALLVAAVVAKPPDAAFEKWLRDNGAEMANVKFVEFTDTGLGAMAKNDMSEGEMLALIPKKLFLTSSRMNATGMAEVMDVVTGLNAQYQLALVLLHEDADQNSFWRPYLDNLPRKLDTAVYFTEEELEMLRGSNLMAVARSRNEQVKRNYEEVFPFLFEEFSALFPKEVYTLENFKWALSTVWKRSFYVKEGEQTVSALIPGLDLFNHGPVETSFKLDDDAGNIVASTVTPVKKGNQVYLSRGPKSNFELLLEYGYVLDENKSDNVALNVRMTGVDRLARLKASMLEIAGLPVNGTYLLFEEHISEELLTALRIQLLREEDMNLFGKALDKKPVSLPNELRVLRAILAACNNMLEGYGESLEEDETMLKTSLSPRVRSAVLLRKREKEVIQSIMLSVSKRWRDILIEGFPEDVAAAQVEETENAE
eukprot:TRINITY_DN81557_c0_g1_i1.p1 TRINITY_DN81557_c0_g1~~TRINITY_DN81557_c0_g1_i1.p1  ORF type:complete len:480 (+),score=150.05 TRINITY_DN81557_c0_g1_i1:137-1441(+)